MGWDPDGSYYCAFMYYEDTVAEDSSVDGSEDSSEASEIENPFSDISERHKNYDAVIYLYDQGVIGGVL